MPHKCCTLVLGQAELGPWPCWRCRGSWFAGAAPFRRQPLRAKLPRQARAISGQIIPAKSQLMSRRSWIDSARAKSWTRSGGLGTPTNLSRLIGIVPASIAAISYGTCAIHVTTSVVTSLASRTSPSPVSGASRLKSLIRAAAGIGPYAGTSACGFPSFHIIGAGSGSIRAGGPWATSAWS